MFSINITDSTTGGPRPLSVVAAALVRFVNTGDFSPQERFVLATCTYDACAVDFNITFTDAAGDAEGIGKAQHECRLLIAEDVLARVRADDFHTDELIDAGLWTQGLFIDILRVLLVAADNDKNEGARQRAKLAALKIISARG